MDETRVLQVTKDRIKVIEVYCVESIKHLTEDENDKFVYVDKDVLVSLNENPEKEVVAKCPSLDTELRGSFVVMRCSEDKESLVDIFNGEEEPEDLEEFLRIPYGLFLVK